MRTLVLLLGLLTACAPAAARAADPPPNYAAFIALTVGVLFSF